MGVYTDPSFSEMIDAIDANIKRIKAELAREEDAFSNPEDE